MLADDSWKNKTMISAGTCQASRSYNTLRGKKGGCGFDEFDESGDYRRKQQRKPSWISYTRQDEEWLKSVESCYGTHDFRSPTWLKKQNDLTKLRCALEIDSSEKVLEVLENFHCVWFIGDSVLQQVYVAFDCMMGLTPVSYGEKNSTDEIKMEAIYRLNNSDSKQSELRLRYTRFGLTFPEGENALYEGGFIESIKSSTEHDVTIVGAGSHYKGFDIGALERATRHIVNASRHSKGKVFYMETPHQEFPTSNGGHSAACLPNRELVLCACQALTEERIQGRASTTELFGESIRQEMTRRTDLTRVGDNLTGQLSLLNSVYEQNFTSEDLVNQDCVPDCLPADWRNDLVRAWLQQDDTNDSKTACADRQLWLIPIWKQLSAQGELQSRIEADCIHKRVDVAMEMAKQVLRALALSL